MRRVFRIGKFFRVPDTTLVAPLFNALDTLSGLPKDLPQGMSIAAGTLAAGSRSGIHLMPHVAQVTFVLSGQLTVRMKDSRQSRPYTLQLRAHEAAFTEAGSFIQLSNEHRRLCKVLYIVTPSYLFESRDGTVRYDDAMVLPEDWHTLARNDWIPSLRIPSRAARAAARRRIMDAD